MPFFIDITDVNSVRIHPFDLGVFEHLSVQSLDIHGLRRKRQGQRQQQKRYGFSHQAPPVRWFLPV